MTLRQRFRKKTQIKTSVESDTDNDFDFNEIQNDHVRSDAVIPSDSLVPMDENEIILPIIKKPRERPQKYVTALLNKQILKNIFDKLEENDFTTHLRDCTRSLYHVPKTRTTAGAKRLSKFIPLFVNKVIRFSYNLRSKDFKTYILGNLMDLFIKFSKSFFK